MSVKREFYGMEPAVTFEGFPGVAKGLSIARQGSDICVSVGGAEGALWDAMIPDGEFIAALAHVTEATITPKKEHNKLVSDLQAQIAGYATLVAELQKQLDMTWNGIIPQQSRVIMHLLDENARLSDREPPLK